MNRVVITGIAPVISGCYDKESFFEKIFAKKCLAVPISEDACRSYKAKTKWIVPYPELDPVFEYDKRLAKLGNRANFNSILASYTAMKALCDAGIEQPDEDMGVIIGISANMGEIVGDCDLIENGKRISPMAIPRFMSNSPAGYISIMLGIHGESRCVSTACASGTTAIGESYRLIQNGASKTMICGGAECLRDNLGLSIHGFDMLKTLTRSEDGIPRCFSEERSGFLFNEGGACCLVLEEYEHAVKRGADIYAEITGYEANSDAYSITAMPEEPVYAKKVVSKLADGIKVDLYNSHGTGTKLNDQTESVLIKSIFGGAETQPYINATKGIIGHTVSASGALEAAVCAYSIKYGKIHGNLLGTPIPDLNIHSETIETNVNTAISSSFGFGGHNAALRFEKVK